MNFRRSPRSWFWLVPAAGLGLTGYLQARALSSLFDAALVPEAMAPRPAIGQKAPAGRPPVSSAEPILERNPFDSTTGPLGPFAPPPPAPEPEPPGLDDPLRAPRCDDVRVVLTTVSTNPFESRAVLQAEGEPRGVTRRVGDQVAGLEIAFIGRNPLEWSPAVWLTGSEGLCQSLLFDQPDERAQPKAAKADDKKKSKKKSSSKTPKLPAAIARGIDRIGPGRYRVERSAVEAILEKGVELLRSVRMRPKKDGGKVVGMELKKVRSGTLLHALGLKSGDQIQSINGFNLNGPAAALQAYARLRVADNIRVEAVRGGKPLELEYRIQ